MNSLLGRPPIFEKPEFVPMLAVACVLGFWFSGGLQHPMAFWLPVAPVLAVYLVIGFVRSYATRGNKPRRTSLVLYRTVLDCFAAVCDSANAECVRAAAADIARDIKDLREKKKGRNPIGWPWIRAVVWIQVVQTIIPIAFDGLRRSAKALLSLQWILNLALRMRKKPTARTRRKPLRKSAHEHFAATRDQWIGFLEVASACSTPVERKRIQDFLARAKTWDAKGFRRMLTQLGFPDPLPPPTPDDAQD